MDGTRFAWAPAHSFPFLRSGLLISVCGRVNWCLMARIRGQGRSAGLASSLWIPSWLSAELVAKIEGDDIEEGCIVVLRVRLIWPFLTMSDGERRVKG